MSAVKKEETYRILLLLIKNSNQKSLWDSNTDLL